MNHWVDSNQKLQQMCEKLARIATVAIDTEFIRTDTFFPKIALIQISDGEDCWLLDVL
ncbi:MAG: ribonuclease D, partial [Porticoccaceae bacterium]